MPNPKLETYKNKATNTVYDLTDANAQASLTAILDGTSIDSFADVESALAGKFPREEQRVLGAVNISKPSSVASKSSSGVTFTNTNGVVVANNQATADAYMGWDIGHLPKGRYKLVGCPVDGSASKYCVRLGVGDTASDWGTYVNADYGDGFVFEVDDESKYYSVACRIFNGYTANNVTFKPMITPDTSVSYDDYVPYAMTNRELTEKKVDKEPTTLTSSDDIDNIFDDGWYRWSGGSIPTHWVGGSWAVMRVITSIGAKLQIGYTQNEIYIRRYGGSPQSWGSFTKFTGTVVS